MRGQPGTFLYFLARRLTKIQIHGQENLTALDVPGPAMIVINHTTVVDVVVVVGTLHKLGYTVDGPCKGVCTHRRHLRPVGTSDMWNFPLLEAELFLRINMMDEAPTALQEVPLTIMNAF